MTSRGHGHVSCAGSRGKMYGYGAGEVVKFSSEEGTKDLDFLICPYYS